MFSDEDSVSVGDTEVLIIGGGVIGVCCAYYLALAGRRVLLLERGEICSGCSYGNAGWIVPSHCIPLAAPGVLAKALKWMWNPESPFYLKPRLDWQLFKWLLGFAAACNPRKVKSAMPLLRDLTRASMKLYAELATRLGLEFGYRQTGSLMLFDTQNGLEQGQHDSEALAEVGIRSSVLTADEVRTREPGVVPKIAGGVYYHEDAYIDPAEFVRGLAKRAEDHGAKILTGTKATGFRLQDDRIAEVKTSAGNFSAATVVLAAGAQSGLFAQMLQINLPIQPGKGYSFRLASRHFRPLLPLLLSESKIAITPMGEKVRFSGTLELTGQDTRINQRRVNAILSNTARYLSIRCQLPQEQWSGLRPCTPDGLPVISRSSTLKNLVVATGHAMIGISLGPITGKLVAQLVCKEVPQIELSQLSLSRFA